MNPHSPSFLVSCLWQRFKASAYWKDIAWLSSGMVVAQAITLVTLPVFTRLFTPSDFAVQNLFSQIAGFVAIAATLRYEYFFQLPKRHSDGLQLIQLVAILGFLAAVLLTPVAWLFRVTFARWAGNECFCSGKLGIGYCYQYYFVRGGTGRPPIAAHAQHHGDPVFSCAVPCHTLRQRVRFSM